MDKMIHDAMMSATDTPEFNNGGYYWPPQYVEKFAELIVEGICETLAKNKCPLSLTQVATISQHFPEN